ncbi:MAG: protein-glutamate O-methyltransferase CheR [Polyangiaceae bacterium]|jgi:chemotaxis protein methyltransferase CheR
MVSPSGLAYVRELVYRRSAIVIEGGKEYLIESRLGPLARAEGFASIDEMVGRLRAQPANGLHSKVVEAMTTNETSFFRDLHPFDALRTEIVPKLRKARAVSRRIRIWSAACSMGQEAYTIAMVLREHFPDLMPWDVRIIGTDLASAMVTRAQKGLFSQLEVNRGLPAPLLVKYFDRAGVQWQIKQSLRDMFDVRQMNLVDPWPSMPIFDVVFLRNVLIYFDVPTKQRVLSRVRQVLAPDGYLFLGGAETTLRVDDSFKRIQVDKAVYYRPGGAEAGK